MGATVYQITNPAIVYSAIYLGADQRKLQSPVSLAFLRGINYQLIPCTIDRWHGKCFHLMILFCNKNLMSVISIGIINKILLEVGIIQVFYFHFYIPHCYSYFSRL